jgi:CHAD domain-containing protein
MTTDEARPLEVELKYRMTDTSAGDRLLGADELAGLAATGEVETVVHDDRYVDTADGALAAAGWFARLRATGDGTLITLKGLARHDDGGVTHRREELEGPAEPLATAGDWPPSPARDVLTGLVGESPLEEVVRIRQVRRKRAYGGDEALVELSVDDVEVLVSERTVERFAELEVELRRGPDAALEPLADLLAEVEELVPAETSKLERALAAVQRDAETAEDTTEVAVEPPPGPTDGSDAGPTDDGAKVAEAVAGDRPKRKGRAAVEGDGRDASRAARRTRRNGSSPSASALAEAEGQFTGPGVAPADARAEPEPERPRLVVPKTPGVVAEDHLAEAGRKVLRFHLARMIAREPGTREGSDPEELHGMRVATRRQRAAWRVFGDAYDPVRTTRYTRRLKAVARDLGAVRDLDVLIEAAEAYRSRQPEAEAAAFEPLIESWRAQRESARSVLVRELDAGKYRRWLDGYVAFTVTDGLAARPVGPVEPHRVRDRMPSRIWAAYENLRAYEAVMRWADVTTLHELRIAAKWLRYTLEFVREALGRDAGPLIEKVVALQDHLGWLHDADVAAGLARQFLVEHAGDLSEAESAAIGRYLVDRERELARLRRTVGPPWRGVASLSFRRALGRVVAGL